MLPLWPISISSNFIVESELTLSVKAVLVISVNDEIFLITPSMWYPSDSFFITYHTTTSSSANVVPFVFNASTNWVLVIPFATISVIILLFFIK